MAENKDYIDVQYLAAGKKIYCEIKPTENIETCYAIRAAIGQLLEYRFKHDHTANLEIVLGKKPPAAELAFVKSIGMRLTYYDAKIEAFITC